jgi:hypothetical protein
MKSHIFSWIIPLVLFYLLFSFPDQFLDVSIHPLGRLISVLFILYYANIHYTYGILACALVIFYYQMDCVEGMAQFNQCGTVSCYLPKKEPAKSKYMRNKKQIPLFYEKPSKKDVLLDYENKKFVDVACCKKSGKCVLSLEKQLDDEEDLVYPKLR